MSCDFLRQLKDSTVIGLATPKNMDFTPLHLNDPYYYVFYINTGSTIEAGCSKHVTVLGVRV